MPVVYSGISAIFDYIKNRKTMDSATTAFAKGREVVRRISLDEMYDTWNECSTKYGTEWSAKNDKNTWIEATKKPNWSADKIYDAGEGCWIEFEDWLECLLAGKWDK